MDGCDLESSTGVHEGEPSYDFVPYRFGCFSFQSYADRSALIRKGLILEREQGAWEITTKAKAYLDKNLIRKLQLFVEKTIPERGNSLVARVYRE